MNITRVVHAAITFPAEVQPCCIHICTTTFSVCLKAARGREEARSRPDDVQLRTLHVCDCCPKVLKVRVRADERRLDKTRFRSRMHEICRAGKNSHLFLSRAGCHKHLSSGSLCFMRPVGVLVLGPSHRLAERLVFSHVIVARDNTASRTMTGERESIGRRDYQTPDRNPIQQHRGEEQKGRSYHRFRAT